MKPSLLTQVVLAISVACAAAGSVRGNRNLSLFDNSSDEKKNTRIIGGSQTSNTRFPYAVSIQDDIGHFCGGSLIAPDMVLTAAHCQGGPYNVVIGRHDLDSNNGESIPMKKEIPNPSYNDYTTDSDWMLVVLERPTTLNVPFIKLNSAGSSPNVGEEVTVMGWGDTTAEDDTSKLSDVLMSVDVNVISNQDCDDSSGSINGWSDNYHGQISENMLCARDNGQDSCQGDSGGPLIIQGADASSDVQVGVVSWGVGCASKDFPGVYSCVSKAYNWIKQEVCKQSSNPPSDLCNGGSASDDDVVGQAVTPSQNNDDGGQTFGGDDDYYYDDNGFSDQGGSSGGSSCSSMNKFECKASSHCEYNKYDKTCSQVGGGSSSGGEGGGGGIFDAEAFSSGGESSGESCSGLSKHECKANSDCFFNKYDRSCSKSKR